MANNPVKWSAYDATLAALFSASELKNLANAASVFGATAVSNAAGSQYADIELLFNTGSAVSAGGYVAIWFVRAIDGSNYEDGASATPARPPDLVIPLRAASGSQKVAMGAVLWPQGTFKVLFQNNSGQTTTNTDSLTQLSFRAYNDNLVTA